MILKDVYEHKDKYGRILNKTDKCIKVSIMSRNWKPKIELVEVLDFTNYKVKIGEKRYVDANNLILLSHEGLL